MDKALTSFVGTANPKARTYEGKGANSPEAALRAYLRAYRDMDVDAIVSACAVESYAEHYDLEELVVQNRLFSTNMVANVNGVIIPNDLPLAKGLNAAFVASGIRNAIYNGVLNFAFFEASIARQAQDGSINFVEEQDYVEFFAALADTEKLQTISSLKIEKILTEADFVSYSPKYSDAANQRAMNSAADRYGGKLADVAAVVSIGGAPYLFCAYAVEYDGSGRWYIIPNASYFLGFLGAFGYFGIVGGPIPISEDTMDAEAVRWLRSLK
ncbi:MAG: hypothetical protein LBJ84_04205 [Oscillospiraceae bacterium]|nr:hypothetical protein [Oscillospiraceae bacterium]